MGIYLTSYTNFVTLNLVMLQVLGISNSNCCMGSGQFQNFLCKLSLQNKTKPNKC